MKRLITTMAVAPIPSSTSASTFDPVHLERLKATNECESCDLSAANLSSVELAGANLANANLINANITQAKLK